MRQDATHRCYTSGRVTIRQISPNACLLARSIRTQEIILWFSYLPSVPILLDTPTVLVQLVRTNKHSSCSAALHRVLPTGRT